MADNKNDRLLNFSASVIVLYWLIRESR